MNMKKVRWTFDSEAENKKVGCRTTASALTLYSFILHFHYY